MWLFKTRKQYPQNDAEIISAYKNTGDKQLIGILFERYAHLVYGVCYKYVKDKEVCRDATLFIFEKLFVDLRKYEVTNFSSWLHSVARNYCFAYLKTVGRDVSLDEITLSSITDTNEQTEEDHLIKTHLLKLPDALAAINNEQQKCIRMFYLDDKSYIEIAEQTGYSLNQVKSFIQNGKRNLRIYLTKQQGK